MVDLQIVNEIFVGLTVFFLAVLAFAMKTQNFISSVIFKVVPFILLIGLLLPWLQRLIS